MIVKRDSPEISNKSVAVNVSREWPGMLCTVIISYHDVNVTGARD